MDALENYCSETIVLKKIISLYNSQRTLYGCNSEEFATGYGDRIFMDYILGNNTFSQIVEFGTHQGVTTLHLGMSAKVLNIPLHTYDITDIRPPKIINAWLDNMIFHEENILTLNQNVIEIISKPNTFIFMDNGNKIKEFNQYMPYIGKDSVIIVHDWGQEVHEEDIMETVYEFKLIEYLPELSNTLGNNCKAWKKYINAD